MHYISNYSSGPWELCLAADDVGLCGLWIEGQKYYGRLLDGTAEKRKHPVFSETRRWLDIYFSGAKPDFTPPLHLVGSEFQLEVWNMLLAIPYGETRSYGDIAALVAARREGSRMSPQAVGAAVGKNPISIIVPCHRVVGANGSLTGYAGGIDRKIALLKLESAYKDSFFVPAHSTAP